MEVTSHPTICRELFIEVIRHYVTRGKASSGYAMINTKSGMDHNNLRIGLLLDRPMSHRIEVFDGIKNGIRVANMYGRVVGWRPIELTECVIAASEGMKKVSCYLLVGDAGWQRTPQYVSMLILIIRLCLEHRVPEWIEDAYAIQGF